MSICCKRAVCNDPWLRITVVTWPTFRAVSLSCSSRTGSHHSPMDYRGAVIEMKVEVTQPFSITAQRAHYTAISFPPSIPPSLPPWLIFSPQNAAWASPLNVALVWTVDSPLSVVVHRATRQNIPPHNQSSATSLPLRSSACGLIKLSPPVWNRFNSKINTHFPGNSDTVCICMCVFEYVCVWGQCLCAS